jgi:hypothetical protein
MRRRAKAEKPQGRDQELRRHDVARRAWSDEPMSVVQRLEAGVTDLQSRLNAERLRLEPQPSLSSHLRQRIEAARDLIRVLGGGRAPPMTTWAPKWLPFGYCVRSRSTESPVCPVPIRPDVSPKRAERASDFTSPRFTAG